MAAVTICSDLETPKIKSATISIVSLSICHEVMEPDAMILVFWLSILFYTSIFLFLCQYHSVFFLWWWFYSIIWSQWVWFLQLCFSFWLLWLFGVFCVSIQILRFLCSSSVKNDIGNLIECNESVDCFGYIGILILLILLIQEHGIAINLWHFFILSPEA